MKLEAQTLAKIKSRINEKMMKKTWLMWPWWVMIPIEDLTDVTLAVEDTNEDDEEVEDDEKDLTDMALVSDDTYWKLDWSYSSNWRSY